MKILIVDDIETNRKLLRINLEAEGIASCEAVDGLEGLAVLEREKPDAIISDILMPHMDGYRFCQEVRKDKRFRGIPFIFYTSTYTSPGDERLALNCGGDLYIKKPAPIGVIMEALRDLVAPGRQPSRQAPPPEEAVVMREYNEALVRKLEERNEKLERARAEIALANQELERRVAERTAELQLANEELEAFSHSIAHDLRSPLSVIDGFSHLLLEECRGKISTQAMDSLHFISEATRRMNELTSDLLRLARANRAAMNPQKIDLSALANAVLQDLQAGHPKAEVALVVDPRIAVVADFGLMRIVLENLLGNAWKYTGKKKQARIEFGAGQRNGQRVYFVRDNGAGFEMGAAAKLFTPFCRLHSEEDFPGTGIGLSTVQRIIARHGGSIWAEAEAGRGATFYFTVGTSPGTSGKAILP